MLPPLPFERLADPHPGFPTEFSQGNDVRIVGYNGLDDLVSAIAAAVQNIPG
jgi:hypothetical protein